MANANIGQLGNVPTKNKTATQAVLNAAAAAGHNLTQVWGVGGGDHADGYATDFMVYNDRAAGDWIADYIWANRGMFGVRWIIWRQRIRSTSPGRSGSWVTMEDRGSGTQNHMDHVHVKWSAWAVTGLTGPAAPGSAGPKLAPNKPPTGLSVRVSNLQRGLGSRNEDDDNDIRQYNIRLGECLGAWVDGRNREAWAAESRDVYGPMTAQGTYDLYASLKKQYPQDSRWTNLPTHDLAKDDPAMPGRELLVWMGFGIVGE